MDREQLIKQLCSQRHWPGGSERLDVMVRLAWLWQCEYERRCCNSSTDMATANAMHTKKGLYLKGWVLRRLETADFFDIYLNQLD